MAKLALNGGEPVVRRTLGKPWPIFDEREEKALLEVLHSGAWNRRDKVDQVGEAFAAYQDATYGIPLANGTVALQCALKAAGVDAGDEVIVPALTFVATATSVVLVNAVPIMVDIDPLTYNISPAAIEAAITPRTRAIIPVHNGGYPADMDAIMEIADRRDLCVIEDCAHAHGSQWRGKGLGSIGHLGTFSFQIGKTLTCGEGGMVLTNDEALAENAARFANLNMRMTNLQAALLLCQLERFDAQVETRERNTAYLVKGMKAIKGIDPIPRDARVTRWCFYYWDFRYIPDEFDGIPRDRFLEALKAEGVPCGVGAHGQPIYREGPFADMAFFDQLGCARKGSLYDREIDYGKVYCPEAERVYAEEVCSFPHAMFLGERDDMDAILAAFRKLRENTDELKSK
ncbi:MAG: DegT/DnrJ/EryC1/StrS family aminotransferase [Candidatus Poribacteria bacterium]|nr:DegT/DnrJ/EryC1/StrS family aminotransferase [Candidatus Poribacteria bacterium]